jgi:mannosyltransferase OCH1-like enzyme
MKNNTSCKIYEAYLKCPLPVMKADLWRYCIIYENGGIYADADTICLIDPKYLINFYYNYNLIFALEGKYGLPNLFCQWWFAAPKKSPILKIIIDNIVNKILSTNFQNITDTNFIHKITGPTIFTESIEQYLYMNNIPIFKNKYNYLLHTNKLVKIYDPNIFHTKYIKHLGTGSSRFGWKNQKTLFLKNNLEKKVVNKNNIPPHKVSMITNE